MVWNDFDKEPTTLVKLMLLHFGDEGTPDVQVPPRPGIRASVKDIMGQDVIVSKGWYDRNDQVVGRIVVRFVFALAEDFVELVDEELIQFNDLLGVSREPLVIVMASRITSPDDKVDLVFDLVTNPVKRCVDQGDWRIAVGSLGAVVARWT